MVTTSAAQSYVEQECSRDAIVSEKDPIWLTINSIPKWWEGNGQKVRGMRGWKYDRSAISSKHPFDPTLSEKGGFCKSASSAENRETGKENTQEVVFQLQQWLYFLMSLKCADNTRGTFVWYHPMMHFVYKSGDILGRIDLIETGCWKSGKELWPRPCWSWVGEPTWWEKN